ncbi:SWIB/MDM2 domain superfamily protein [Prunus dulcis]|uniref:SWIB/MDM2 domain superfamily protein n=1 Tax=Prunus dulcis TaxID=3755 RepID=A0A4Y1S0B5_PRUDU|nr:SWIB/MDM2 domain superfamily protein [Prunus dulcis]
MKKLPKNPRCSKVWYLWSALRREPNNLRLNDMAATTGLISSTFLSGETSSFPNTSFSSSSSSLRFPHTNFPANLRMVRIPTLATASKPATTPRQPRGIMKPRKVSPEMQALVGTPEISRTQALKLIWAHIKQNNLQTESCVSTM